jgi:hypothetical protein
LRDIDGDGYRERVERMLAEERPSLPDIDGDALARQRDYQSQDLEEALSSFTAAPISVTGAREQYPSITCSAGLRSAPLAGRCPADPVKASRWCFFYG